MDAAPRFAFLDHTADIKVQAHAPTLETLFETCVAALSSYMSRSSLIHKKHKKIVTLTGGDNNSLLYQLLDEVIYLVDAEGFLAACAHIRIVPEGLDVELEGDTTHSYTLTQVKAATYAEMEIKKVKSEWHAQFVLDV